MNTANWIPDLFMKRMESREDWTLFRSNEVSDLHDLYGKAFEDKYHEYEKQAQDGKIWSQSIPAIDLWKQMLKMLLKQVILGLPSKIPAILEALRITQESYTVQTCAQKLP